MKSLKEGQKDREESNRARGAQDGTPGIARRKARKAGKKAKELGESRMGPHEKPDGRPERPGRKQ